MHIESNVICEQTKASVQAQCLPLSPAMVLQSPFFSTNICCCSATVASQVLACFAVAVCAGVAAVSWIYNESIYLPIYQSFLLGAEIIACILVFVACCTIQPAFMYPIIIIQIWNSVSIIAIAIWSLINWSELVSNYGALYYTCFFPVSLVFSLCVLYCHFCCYKLLVLFEKHAHQTQMDPSITVFDEGLSSNEDASNNTIDCESK